MKTLYRLFRHHPGHYIAAAAVCALIALLALIRDGFNQRIAYVNAFEVAGAVGILLGMLLMVTYFGAFDIFGYSFSYFRDRHYDSLYTYSESRKEKRSARGWTFMPLITVGAAFLLIGLLISLLWPAAPIEPGL